MIDLPPGCPLWVKSRHLQCKTLCPLYSQERTLRVHSQNVRYGPKADIDGLSGPFAERLVFDRNYVAS